jgi:hypothetical protein
MLSFTPRLKDGICTNAAPSTRTTIIESNVSDYFKHLFDNDKITQEQWQMITSIRKLAYQGRRSQAVQTRLKSHGQYWGMPHICSNDSYINARAETKWKRFMLYLKPFVQHQWLDTKILQLLFHGGRVLTEDDLKNAKMPNKALTPRPSDESLLGLTLDSIQHMLLIISYVYERVHRRR